jgi:hypothetical protein
MQHFPSRPLLAFLLFVLVDNSANATQNCLKGMKPYKMADDTVEWSVTIKPGADCIQGLRWSTMQIFNVSVAEGPKTGKIVLVGPGFRYFANPDFNGTDKFTLVVEGQNRYDKGKSTIQITVSKSDSLSVVSSADYPD